MLNRDFFRISLEFRNRSYPLLLVLFLCLLSSDVATEEFSTAPDVVVSLPHTQSKFNSNEFSLDLTDRKRSKKLSAISIEDISRLASRTTMEKTLNKEISLLSERQAFDFVSECESIADLDLRTLFLQATFSHVTKRDIRRTLHRFSAMHPHNQLIVVETIYENIELRDEPYAIQAAAGFSWELQELAMASYLSTHKDATLEQLTELAKSVPAFVVPLVTELIDRGSYVEISLVLIDHWAREDVEIALRLTRDLHNQSYSDRLLILTAQAVAKWHPVEALEFTHEYHRYFGFTFEQAVFHSIAHLDSRKAIELIPSIRKSYPPVLSRRDLRKTLFDLGPQYAVDFGRSLPREESESFFRRLKYDFYDTDPQLFIDVIKKIPFPDLVSEISIFLLFETRRKDKLTRRQFRTLNKHLLEDDKLNFEKTPRSSFIRD